MTRFGNMTGCAVDLGGTKIAAARFVDGKVQKRCKTTTDGAADAEALIDTIASLLAELDFEQGEPLGLAAAGRVDAKGNWDAVNSATLSKVRNVPLGRLMEHRFGPCKVINDAAAATIAEAQFGLGQGIKNFAFVTISTGVGGGLVLDGRLHQTGDGMAGHLGFMTSRHASGLCGSGRTSTIESIASGRAIESAARTNGHMLDDARAIAQAAAEGEVWAKNLFEISAQAIADLCGDLRALLGIETIAIGGGIGLSAGYIGKVTRHISALPKQFQTSVDTAKTGSDGPLAGSLFMRLSGQ